MESRNLNKLNDAEKHASRVDLTLKNDCARRAEKYQEVKRAMKEIIERDARSALY